MSLTSKVGASRLRALLVAAPAAAVIALVPLAAARAQQGVPAPAAQKSANRGVTVIVRPLDLSSAARIWVFEVALDTHSAELSDDLMKAAVLVDDRGVEHRPAGWKRDPPGGHHRKGTLEFAPVAPRPGAVELRVQRPRGRVRPADRAVLAAEASRRRRQRAAHRRRGVGDDLDGGDGVMLRALPDERPADVGASGLAALPAQYQVELFWLGLAASAAGTAFVATRLVRAMREHARCAVAS